MRRFFMMKNKAPFLVIDTQEKMKTYEMLTKSKISRDPYLIDTW